MALQLTDASFEETIREGVVVVDFWAEWCGPCKRLSPIVEKLAEEYAGKATVAKVNVEECTDVCEQYGITNIPTVLFFRNGELANKIVGYSDEKKLSDIIDGLL